MFALRILLEFKANTSLTVDKIFVKCLQPTLPYVRLLMRCVCEIDFPTIFYFFKEGTMMLQIL